MKWAISFHAARTLTPEIAYELIREKTKKAIARIKEFKPYKVKQPVQLDVRFKAYRPSELLEYLSIVERTDSHSIRFEARTLSKYRSFWSSSPTTNPRSNPDRIEIAASWSLGAKLRAEFGNDLVSGTDGVDL